MTNTDVQIDEFGHITQCLNILWLLKYL